VYVWIMMLSTEVIIIFTSGGLASQHMQQH